MFRLGGKNIFIYSYLTFNVKEYQKGGKIYRFEWGRCNIFRNFDFDRNSIQQEKLL